MSDSLKEVLLAFCEAVYLLKALYTASAIIR